MAFKLTETVAKEWVSMGRNMDARVTVEVFRKSEGWLAYFDFFDGVDSDVRYPLVTTRGENRYFASLDTCAKVLDRLGVWEFEVVTV